MHKSRLRRCRLLNDLMNAVLQGYVFDQYNAPAADVQSQTGSDDERTEPLDLPELPRSVTTCAHFFDDHDDVDNYPFELLKEFLPLKTSPLPCSPSTCTRTVEVPTPTPVKQVRRKRSSAASGAGVQPRRSKRICLLSRLALA
jgi:hypothetical protein